MRTADWTETASETAALATATRAAETDHFHNVGQVVASYSAAQIGLLTIKRGTTTLAEHYVHNEAVIDLVLPLRGLVGQAVSAELAAGGAGVVGKVAIIGYTD